MKEQFLKWIKRYGVTMWLIAAILALAASVSYAAYVNQDIKKFVLMTGKGNQAFFSSNYLYLTDIKGTNYRSRRIPSTQDANNYYTFPVKICNHVYGNEEMVNLVDSSLEFWLTAGRYTEKFEKEFAEYLGVRFCSLVNSGSISSDCETSILLSSKY